MALARARSTAAPLSRLQLLIAAYFPSKDSKIVPSSDPRNLVCKPNSKPSESYRVRMSQNADGPAPDLLSEFVSAKRPNQEAVILRGKEGLNGSRGVRRIGSAIDRRTR